MKEGAAWMQLTPEKIAILKNPTEEGALKLWPFHIPGMEKPEPNAPMAGLHRARIVWAGSTKKQVKESKQWLRDHGFRVP